jgi:hypothetical protein
MAVYACRWENGDISFVAARSKSEAVDLLDEVDAASPKNVFLVPAFLLNLRLGPGGLEFETFGEVMGFGKGSTLLKAYPILYANESPMFDDPPDPEKLAGAIEAEKKRLWPEREAAGREVFTHVSLTKM